MMQTTLNAIKYVGFQSQDLNDILTHLNKLEIDDEPLALSVILDALGFNRALLFLSVVEGYDKEIILYTVRCARQVQHLMDDERSITALDVAERYAKGCFEVKEITEDKWLRFKKLVDIGFFTDYPDAVEDGYEVFKSRGYVKGGIMKNMKKLRLIYHIYWL